MEKVAVQHYEKNEYRDAATYLDSLIAGNPKEGKYFYMRGVCENAIFKFNESTRDFLKSAELNYRQSDAFYNVSLNYRIQKNDSMARIYLKKVLKLDPSDLKASRDLDLLSK